MEEGQLERQPKRHSDTNTNVVKNWKILRKKEFKKVNSPNNRLTGECAR
jgi:hypothetical protein